MANKKTTPSTGKKPAPQPVTTARRPRAEEEKTSSGRKKQTPQPEETAIRSEAEMKRTAGRQQREMQQWIGLARFLGAFVMLFFGFVGVVSWFNRDGSLMNAYHAFISAQFGWGYYLMPLCMLSSAWLMFTDKDRPCAGRVVSSFLVVMLFGSFVQLVGCRMETLYSLPRLTESGLGYALSQLISYGQDPVYCCGGMFSGLLAALFYTCLRRVFGCILLIVIIVPLCVYMLGGDVRALADFVISLPYRAKPIAARVGKGFLEFFDGKLHGYDDAVYDDEFWPDEIEGPEEHTDAEKHIDAEEHIDVENLSYEEEFLSNLIRKRAAVNTQSYSGHPVTDDADIEPQDVAAVPVAQKDLQPSSSAEEELFQAISGGRKSAVPYSTPRHDAGFDIDLPLDDIVPESVLDGTLEPVPEPVPESKPEIKAGQAAKPRKAAASKTAPKPAEKTAPEPKPAPAPVPEPEEPTDQYIFPPLELLRRGTAVADNGDESDDNRKMLEAAIQSFDVKAEVTGVVRGPSVTRYEMKLAQGVKLSRITNLSGDIALSLGVSSVRIAPIADKISTVGVEVPNRTTQTVWLGDTIDTDAFRKSKSKLSIALGKDISGNVIVGNIAKMPHVLIAGTTGSGKSVCINSLILSILYKSTPDEAKLIMVDPKMVELGIYNSLPHMLTPVVTDPKKAAGALQWAVVEMLKRYRLFSEVGVRDLAGYNAVLQSNDQKIIPQVVIIIDELADLMMTAKKEVEESICRIAQMGRAAGMHLVVATQRPSSDVITGLMKANIPSRIAFAVSSGIESRIILDQQGAEKLIGMGDMLYAPIGVGKPVRIQGAFVTDEEREEVINFIKAHSEAEYDDEATREMEKNAAALENAGKKKGSDDFESGTDSAGEEYDELLPQAVEVIFEVKQASTSMLQRRLKLGYSRAGRLIDQLEQLGVVGPYQGSKPREILMTKQQWQERQYIHGTAPTDSIAAELTDIADRQSAEDADADDEPEFLEDED